jgi:UPF0755 protein
VKVSPDEATVPLARKAIKRARAARRRRRAYVLLLALGLLVGVAVFGGVEVVRWLTGPPDFDGPGAGSVVVRVEDGATTSQIARVLERNGVVASAQAFTEEATAPSVEERIRSVQPGFYQMRAGMSAESAVELLLDPVSRVGRLEIRGGVQLDDTSGADGSIAPGVLTLISRATCLTVDGRERCVRVEELRAAMAGTDPAALGVPDWALSDVRAADPVRRLEGLLVPGLYDVEPGTSAADVLRGILDVSSTRLEASGIVSGAENSGFTPYEVLVVASLVEKEGVTADMPKVARVIYNRLGSGRRLELDSTVNYPLDRQALRTTPEDRARVGAYNSYAGAGLPPTPIAAPGRDALAAALSPEDGPWEFFVRCQPDGVSCFAVSLAEHQANVRLAIENGAF